MVETLTGQRAKCSRGEQLTAGRGCGAWRHWYFGGWWLCCEVVDGDEFL